MNTQQKIWTGDRLIGLSALFISLLTLGVFIYQTSLIRKQQYMSVYPHLNITNYNTGSLNYKFVLKNEGIGPAFLTSIKVISVDGEEHEQFVSYLDHMLVPEDSVEYHYSDIYEGRMISADEEVILFGLSDRGYLESIGKPANTIRSAAILHGYLNSDNMRTYRIEYESIYGERWAITHESDIPEKQ